MTDIWSRTAHPTVSTTRHGCALGMRVKKFERGDYDKEKLKEFVRQLMPKVLCSLQTILLGNNKHECSRVQQGQN